MTVSLQLPMSSLFMKINTKTGITLQLRKFKHIDATEFLQLAKENKEFHRPWIYVPSNKKMFAAYVEEMWTSEDKAYLVQRLDNKAFVGVIELRDIFLGDFRNAYACWYAFAGQTGQGYMRAALPVVIDIAFSKLKLHRLEANIQPENIQSINLAHACGFKREGYSPKFLRKNGEWRDHERWAMINPYD